MSSAVWAGISEVGPRSPTEAGAAGDLVSTARRAGAWVGMPAATSQACFIARADSLKAGELVGVAERVVYLRGSSPDDDPIVRIADAITGWRVAFPNLIVVTLLGRPARWHLPLVEYPRETMRAVTAEY